jgi:hypothetical protein
MVGWGCGGSRCGRGWMWILVGFRGIKCRGVFLLPRDSLKTWWGFRTYWDDQK